MNKVFSLLLFAFLFSPGIMFGQERNRFKIDTFKILTNGNLDYFVQSLRTNTFQNFADKNALPKFVGKQLDQLTNGFSMANPGKPYQCCCTSPKRLPKRQLNFLATSKDVLAMTYETGGFGVSTHLLLIRFDDNQIMDLWTGYCFADIKNVSDIVAYITEARKNNNILNTNAIFL